MKKQNQKAGLLIALFMLIAAIAVSSLMSCKATAANTVADAKHVTGCPCCVAWIRPALEVDTILVIRAGEQKWCGEYAQDSIFVRWNNDTAVGIEDGRRYFLSESHLVPSLRQPWQKIRPFDGVKKGPKIGQQN